MSDEVDSKKPANLMLSDSKMWPKIEEIAVKFVQDRIFINEEMKMNYYNIFQGWVQILVTKETNLNYLYAVFKTDNEEEINYIENCYLSQKRGIQSLFPRLSFISPIFKIPVDEQFTRVFIQYRVARRIAIHRQNQQNCEMIVERYGYLDIQNPDLINMLYMLAVENDEKKIQHFERVTLESWKLPKIPIDSEVQAHFLGKLKDERIKANEMKISVCLKNIAGELKLMEIDESVADDQIAEMEPESPKRSVDLDQPDSDKDSSKVDGSLPTTSDQSQTTENNTSTVNPYKFMDEQKCGYVSQICYKTNEAVPVVPVKDEVLDQKPSNEKPVSYAAAVLKNITGLEKKSELENGTTPSIGK